MKTVQEIMHSDVVTVRTDTTLHDLARIFSDHDISGAPVVDNENNVVGVVSTTDVIRFVAEEIDVNVRAGAGSLVATDDWVATGEAEGGLSRIHEFLGSDLDDYVVENIMTTANFHVSPDTSVPELAEFLLKGRIHRALVMEDGRLEGIVTTVDVLRTVTEL